MKISELKLIYFSPTGTTRKVLMDVAKSIDLKSISYDLTIKKEMRQEAKFSSSDFALFAIPVYYGRVPDLFLEYLNHFTGNNTPAAIVATYGCRAYDDALLELKTELENRGFKVIGAGAFPVEHSLAPTIGYRRPTKEDLKSASDFGIELNRKLKQAETFDDVDLTVPGNSPYKPYGKPAFFPKGDSTYCTECMACVKACPAGAISVDNPRKTDHKKCIGCLKCVHICKPKARLVSPHKVEKLIKKLDKVCDSNKQAEIFL